MAYTEAGAKAFMQAHKMQVQASMENHPAHVQHVRDQIDYVNTVAEHYYQQVSLLIDQKVRTIVREEINRALSDPMIQLKVDQKSVQSSEKSIRSIFQSLFR